MIYRSTCCWKPIDQACGGGPGRKRGTEDGDGGRGAGWEGRVPGEKNHLWWSALWRKGKATATSQLAVGILPSLWAHCSFFLHSISMQPSLQCPPLCLCYSHLFSLWRASSLVKALALTPQGPSFNVSTGIISTISLDQPPVISGEIELGQDFTNPPCPPPVFLNI